MRSREDAPKLEMERVSIAKSCWSVGERKVETSKRRRTEPESHSDV